MPLRRLAIVALFLAPVIAAADRPPGDARGDARGEARGQPRGDISGVYASNWDEVRLTQDGDRVHGTYVCCGGGTIEGRIIEGRTVRYRWKQPGAAGMGVWTISGNQLRGTWGHGRDEADGGRWDLASSQQVAR